MSARDYAGEARVALHDEVHPPTPYVPREREWPAGTVGDVLRRGDDTSVASAQWQMRHFGLTRADVFPLPWRPRTAV